MKLLSLSNSLIQTQNAANEIDVNPTATLIEKLEK